MNRHKGHIVGYVRVSAVDQNEARQVAALGEVDRMFSEKISGRTTDRPQLTEMLAYVREGDVVRVKSPDRLSRSTRDLLSLVERLKNKGVELEFVDSPALNTATAMGEFMLTVLAACAQLEWATTKERQAEGSALAKARGVYEREPMLTTEQIAQARELTDAGVPKAAVARQIGCSRQTLYRAIAGEGSYGTVSASNGSVKP